MELIDKILSTEIHKAVELYRDDLKRLGKELYGINCGACGNRLIEIYIKLSKNGNQIIKQKMSRKAQLKKGVVLRVPQMGITWTNESLDFTDEKAEKVLSKFKALESRFEVLPASKEEREAIAKLEKEQKAVAKKKAAELLKKQEEEKKKKQEEELMAEIEAEEKAKK